MDIELRFFATFRAAVGQKELPRSYDVESVSVREILSSLEAEYDGLEGKLLDDEGEIKPQLSILKNGKDVTHMDGAGTTLDDGDSLSVFPPVAGG